MFNITFKQAEEYISRGEITECLTFLIDELSESLHPDADKILFLIIKLNTLFAIYTNNSIFNIYLDNKKKLTQHKDLQRLIWLTPIRAQEVIYEMNFKGYGGLVMKATDTMLKHPGGFLLGITPPEVPDKETNLALKLNLTYSDINKTFFQFTLPFTSVLFEDGKKTLLVTETESGVDVFMEKISIFSEHPFFVGGIQSMLYLGGNTLAHLLDIYSGQEFITYVQLSIPESFHPEFDLIEGEGGHITREIDLSSDRSYFGQDYLPSKIHALKILKKFIEINAISFALNGSELTIDSFSFFKIVLANSETKLALFERMYFFTSSHLHAKYTELYFNKIAKLGGFDNGFLDKFNNFSIERSTDLKSFIEFLLTDVIANRIQYKSGYKYLWKDDKCETSPKKEPDIQPYLFNDIESLCEMKGINVVRENATAEGELDMLFSYTTPEVRIFKVCLEVKLAQHAHITTGIKTQLKPYLNSHQTKLGIYLVLWFKYKDSSKYSLPKKYASVNALMLEVEKNKPAGYDVSAIIIDCTKPMNPSVLK